MDVLYLLVCLALSVGHYREVRDWLERFTRLK